MFRNEIGENWFTNIAVDKWNKSVKYVFVANRFESFKSRLDIFIDKEKSW